MTMRECRNCREVKEIHGRGLCSPCHRYYLKNGKHRTESVRKMKDGATGRCINCRLGKAVSKRLCAACYRYKSKNGVDRPKRFFLRREECRNCGMPREAIGRNEFRRGRCKPCYRYWTRTGENRPAELWNAPLGWCDCGHRATHKDVPLNYMTVDKEAVRTELYNLCDDCYALENEPVL
jgi:hypothetical protein